MAVRCPNCGAVNPDETSFCSQCGVQFVYTEAEQQTPEAGAPRPTQQSWQYDFTPDTAVDIVSSTGATGFVDPNEQPVCSLKNGFLLNLVSGEGWKSEDSVITDKRLYYYGSQGIISKIKCEEIVNLEDITGVSFMHFNPWILCIMGALCSFLAVCMIFAERTRTTPAAYVFLFIGIALLLAFAFTRKAYLRVDYAGGSIRFSVKKYGVYSVRMYQRCLFIQKDLLEKKKKG